MGEPVIRVDTPYGPLDVKIYAGPTSVPGTTYASDHAHPSRAHVFGREPAAPSVGARVITPQGEFLTINGVTYTADSSFVLAPEPMGNLPAGWREERGGYPPLTRYQGVYGYDGPTDAARGVWRATIVPLVLAALADASQEVTEAQALARERFVADAEDRVLELRAEADRLETMAEEAEDA